MVYQKEHKLVESTVGTPEEVILGATSGFTQLEETWPVKPVAQEPTTFYTHFENVMEINASRAVVAAYFDVHQEWFGQCALPMQSEPLGPNGYALTIGRFGAFGYEVEPKIGLELKPADKQGVYRIEAIPVPDYVPPGYDVDFQAQMMLVELPGDGLNSVKTRVQSELDLTVYLSFPKFIRVLPQTLIQKTGDRLLAQIVRQVSNRLNHKVEQNFYARHHVDRPQAK
ncbi:MAG: DUF1997 domain-containing protein [Hormoscilla sp.]